MRLRVTFRVSRDRAFLGTFVARHGRLEVAHLTLWSPGWSRWPRPGIVVANIDVVIEYQRRGIATRLHEIAARCVWRAVRGPLVSDTSLTLAGAGFWEKQHRLGRAVRVFHKRNRFLVPRYVLAVPPPASLA